MAERRILGIDPGTNVMGYGIISIENRTPKLIAMGAMQMPKDVDGYQKLAKIYQRINALITDHHATEFAIEAPFLGKNVQSMLKLGRAQGVAIAAAIAHNLPVTEYAPQKIKQAIAGKTSAPKEQVALILQRIFNYEAQPQKLDATDALAVALCHFFQDRLIPEAPKQKSTISKKIKSAAASKNSWSDFVKNNPGRVL